MDGVSEGVTENRTTRSKPRKGTSNKGQEYEILLPALFSLTFFKDLSVKNFVLRSNVQDFGSLDDLLISLDKSDGQKENYAFQLKHKEKQNLLQHPKCLEAGNKNDFGVLRYCEEFSQIAEREIYRFIIYTNAYFNCDHLASVEKFEIRTDGECPGKKYFFVGSGENATVYNFRMNNETTITDLATEEVYTSFFEKFAVYTSQKNWQEVQEAIIEQFGRMFGTRDRSVAMAYIDIFKFWKMHEYSKTEMTKEELKIKILDLILTPYIIAPSSLDLQSNKQEFALLDSAFAKFDFVLIRGLDDESVKKIISNPHFEQNEDILHLAKNWKFISKHVIKKNFSNTQQETEIKQRIGYYLREKPIVVKIHEGNKSTVVTTVVHFKQVSDKIHFVLLGENSIGRNDFPRFTIFENLFDLQEQDKNIYEDIIKVLRVFVMEKQYTYYELFNNNDVLARKITIKDMFQMLAGNFRLQVEEEILPIPYIPRSVSTTLIKIESIKDMSEDLLVFSHREYLELFLPCEDILEKVLLTVDEYLKEPGFRILEDYVFLHKDRVSVDEFEQICLRNPGRNIHHFAFFNEDFLEWISTKGSIQEVKKHEIVKKTCVNESDMYERFQNRINVIVAPPGIGKSELLKKLKNICPFEVFPILINLREHNAFFKLTHRDEEILDYFISDSTDPFLQEAKRSFAKTKSIIFFFDGLDELQCENVDPALDHIKRLSLMGFKLWVSARSYLQEHVENYFNVFSLDIKTFSEQDQKNYIRKRLKGNVETLINEIFRNIDTILENRDILDLPLQLFMITEILSEYSTVPNNMFVLTQMFNYFITGKYRHFFNKNNCTHWDSLQKIVNDSRTYRLKQYQIAALKSCLSKDEFLFLKLQQDETFLKEIETGDFLGIILKISHNVVVFHHSVTAAYFAASWFAQNFHRNEDFLKKILFKVEHVHTRLIFDMILAENLPAHVAVMHRNVKALEEHRNEVHQIDKGGRSTLHLACSHGCRFSIVKNMNNEIHSVEVLKNMRKIDEESRRILNILLEEEVDFLKNDYVFQWNCLDFCDRTLSLLPVEMILEKYNDCSDTIKKILTLNTIKNHSWTVLFYSAIFSYPKLFTIVLHASKLKPEQSTHLLQEATYWNNWRIVNLLLDQLDVNTKIKKGMTILHMACAMGHNEVVTLLLAKNANVDAVDLFRRTPLHFAVSSGHFQIVEKLLQNNATVDALDENHRTPLHLAVEKGNENLIMFLLEKGASIDKVAGNGWGVLDLAIMVGHTKIVGLLLDRNVQMDKMDKYGTKALHIAATRTYTYSTDVLAMVLSKSKHVDEVTADGRTSLHLVAETGNFDAFEFLLTKGANINACDSSGKSVLHWAVISNRLQITEYLLKHNVEVSVVDNNGRNCLQWAAELGDLPITKVLLTKKSKLVNEQAKNGSTALHWAANNGNNNIIDVLLIKGAKLDLEDKEGRTPLYWAALEGHTETVELLLSKEARHISVGGIPALEFARTKKNNTI